MFQVDEADFGSKPWERSLKQYRTINEFIQFISITWQRLDLLNMIVANS